VPIAIAMFEVAARFSGGFAAVSCAAAAPIPFPGFQPYR
jgi:hypothetical protein